MSVERPAELLLRQRRATSSSSTVGGEIAARSPLQLFWRRFRQDRVAMVSLGFIVLPDRRRDLRAAGRENARPARARTSQNPNLTDAFGSPLGPSSAHPFGVDQLGQDVMSRVIYGTRVSLEVGIVGTGDRDADRRRRRRRSPASTAAGSTRCSRA